jgi:hypothetical protein
MMMACSSLSLQDLNASDETQEMSKETNKSINNIQETHAEVSRGEFSAGRRERKTLLLQQSQSSLLLWMDQLASVFWGSLLLPVSVQETLELFSLFSYNIMILEQQRDRKKSGDGDEEEEEEERMGLAYITDMGDRQINKRSVMVGSLDDHFMRAESRQTALAEHSSFSNNRTARKILRHGWKLVDNDTHPPVGSIRFSSFSHSKGLWTCSFLKPRTECAGPLFDILFFAARCSLEVRWSFASLVGDDHPSLHQWISPQLSHFASEILDQIFRLRRSYSFATQFLKTGDGCTTI